MDDPDGPSIVILDENNYSSDGTLSIPTVDTVSGTDFDICWADLVSDLQCHDVDPAADVDSVALLRFRNLSETDIEAGLITDSVMQRSLDGIIEYRTDNEDPCTTLSSMSFLDSNAAIDVSEAYVETSERVYMLLFAKGTAVGQGAQSMLFVQPRAASDNARVDAVPGCGLLEFSADLRSLTPIRVPAQGPYVVDWGEVTRDGLGNPVGVAAINLVLVAFYEGMTLGELEEQLFDLEQIYTALWEVSLEAGYTIDLGSARNRDTGEAFTGFDRDDGVWLLALMCSDCRNPAPVVLTVLDPRVAG